MSQQQRSLTNTGLGSSSPLLSSDGNRSAVLSTSGTQRSLLSSVSGKSSTNNTTSSLLAGSRSAHVSSISTSASSSLRSTAVPTSRLHSSVDSMHSLDGRTTASLRSLVSTVPSTPSSLASSGAAPGGYSTSATTQRLNLGGSDALLGRYRAQPTHASSATVAGNSALLSTTAPIGRTATLTSSNLSTLTSRPAFLRTTSNDSQSVSSLQQDVAQFMYDDDPADYADDAPLGMNRMDEGTLKLLSSATDDVAETILVKEGSTDTVTGASGAEISAAALKRELLNALAGSLIREPDFYDRENATRKAIVDLAAQVAEFDGEFLLKAALYTRLELNIRSTANFLLALCAHIDTARPHLRRYFNASIRLPSDWLEVAQYSQTIHGRIGQSQFEARDVQLGAIPSSLRRAMLEKFGDFDDYQLGKYNKDKSKSKKAGDKKGDQKNARGKANAAKDAGNDSGSDAEGEGRGDVAAAGDDGETDPDGERPVKLEFTIKQMVRKLHIVQPANRVMSILGKKYPDTLDKFISARLDGVFEASRAGQRMKLPVPETWETQVSMHGNNASTWESLISARKLPYMAMLRNLRNLLKANLQKKFHGMITSRLQDEHQVRNSRQFPLRFFSAYEALEDCLRPPPEPKAGGNGKRKPPKPFVPVDPALVARYRTALDGAIRVATLVNVPPIKGRTLVLCDASANMWSVCGSAKALGKPRSMVEVGLLLGLMCRQACEACELHAFGTGANPHGSLCLALASASSDNILTSLAEMVRAVQAEGGPNTTATQLPDSVVQRMLRERAHIDAVIVLGQTLPGGTNDFLAKYHALINPDLLFVLVDLAGAKVSADSMGDPEYAEFARHPNNVRVAGYSDSILRFVAERGDSSLIKHVEAIGVKHGIAPFVPAATRMEERMEKREQERGGGLGSLRTTPTGKQAASADATAKANKAVEDARSRAAKKAPPTKRRSVRVFISSTFLDMHGERDLLTRFVFPAIRERCERFGLSVHEVDLRWGVPARAVAGKGALEACLTEVERCRPFFIGILGDRYGHVPSPQDRMAAVTNDATGILSWLTSYPLDRSVTELEAHFGALAEPSAAAGRAFFYLRSAALLSEVPPEHVSAFAAEGPAAAQSMAALKSRIRASRLPLFDNYPCKWGGVVNGRPSAGALGAFGSRVAADLWSAIRAEFGIGSAAWSLMREKTLADGADRLTARALDEAAVHEALVDARAAAFFGRRQLLRRLHRAVNASCGGHIVVTGKSGAGKTALLSVFAREIAAARGERAIVVHCVGAAPGSADVRCILARLGHVLRQRCGEESKGQDSTDVAALSAEFLRALRLASASSPEGLIVLLDGLDQLDATHGARSMGWLPSVADVPPNVVIVASVSDGEPLVALRSRLEKRAKEIEVGALSPADRTDIVRGTLGLYRKTLDETSLGDQMRPLIAKRDAALPLFLALACEELRVFGVFERVSERIQSLPSSLPALVEDALGRMELDHGRPLVSAALAALVCSREGLSESELLVHLGRHLRQARDPLPRGLWAPLRCALTAFLAPDVSDASGAENVVAITHGELSRAVMRRYLPVERDRVTCHKALAESFRALADPSAAGAFKGTSARAFVELPHHLAEAHEWKALQSLLCDLRFVAAKAALGLINDLVADYVIGDATGRDLKRALGDERVVAFGAFVTRSAHVLAAHPTLAVQQALNEPDGTAPNTAARAMLGLVVALPAAVPSTRSARVTTSAGARTPTSASLSASNTESSLKHASVVALDNKDSGLDPCEMTVRPSGGVEIVAMAVCPSDDRNAAYGDSDGAVVLSDVVTGKVVRSVAHAGGAAVASLCFAGRSRLCVGRVNGHVEFHNLEAGCVLSVATTAHGGKHVTCVASDPQGGLVASCGWDGRVVMWNPKTGSAGDGTAPDWTFAEPSSRPLQSITFDSEGRRLAAGGWSTTVVVYDTANRTSAYLRFATDDAASLLCNDGGSSSSDSPFSVRSLCFSPDDKRLAAGTLDGRVAVWSVDSSSLLAAFRACDNTPAHSIAFSPRGHVLAVGAGDGDVHVWSGHLGRSLTSIVDPSAITTLQKENPECAWGSLSARGYALAAVPSPDGTRFAVGFHLGCAAIVNRFGEVIAPLIRESTSPSICAAWAADQVVIGCGDGKIRSFLASTGAAGVVFAGHEAAVTSVTYCASRSLFASTSNDTSARLWRITGGGVTCVHVLRGHEAPATSCSFNAAGDRLFTVGRDAAIVCWNVVSGTCVFTLPSAHADWINSVSVSRSGYIMTASNDFNAKVWRSAGGSLEEVCVLRGHTGAVLSCEISDDFGTIAVSAGADGTVRVWQVLTASEVTCLAGHGGRPVVSCAFVARDSSDDAGGASLRVVSSGDDGAVRAWAPLKPCLRARFGGHSRAVRGVAFASSGRLLSCSSDASVRRWSPAPFEDVSEVVSAPADAMSHSSSVSHVCFREDGGAALSCSRDGSIILWSVEAGKVTPTAMTVCAYAVNGVAFAGKTGSSFVAVCDDGTLRSFEHTAAGIRPVNSVRAHEGPASAVACCTSRRLVMTGGWDGLLRIHAADTLASVGTISHHSNWISSVAVSDDGLFFTAASFDGTSSVWRTATLSALRGAQISKTEPSAKFSVPVAAMGAKRPWLITTVFGSSTAAFSVDARGVCHAWNVTTGLIKRSFRMTRGRATHADVVDSRVVMAFADGVVRFYNGNNMPLDAEFVARAPCTAINGRGPGGMAAVGDSLGHVYFVRVVGGVASV